MLQRSLIYIYINELKELKYIILKISLILCHGRGKLKKKILFSIKKLLSNLSECNFENI